MLGLLQGIAIRREAVPERDRMPTHVFIDECQNFLSPTVQTILSENRKFALHLTLAQQTFLQDIHDSYLYTVLRELAAGKRAWVSPTARTCPHTRARLLS